MPTNFSKLSPKIQTALLTIPMYLPSTPDPDAETEQQGIARQDSFLQLQKAIRFKLASFEIGDKIEGIGRKYGFDLFHLANITRLIREYYFGEVRLEDFPKEIERRMNVSLLTAQEIARYIRSEIIDWDPWSQYIAKFPKMTAREIVEKHPKIADIEITLDYIQLKNSDDLEDPTIKNWLRDYVSHLGYERHSQMQRTEYLFHSENGRNLDSQDREKLGIILKSFDENVPLPVDEENGEIVFEGIMEHGTWNMEQKSPPDSPFRQGGEAAVPLSFAKGEPERDLKNNFIKPYPRTEARPSSRPVERPTSPMLSTPQPVFQASRPTPPAKPQINFSHTPFSPAPAKPQSTAPTSPVSNPETNKHFIPESPGIPPIRIQSITEHNEPKPAPPGPPRTAAPPRPKHKIIDPFSGPRREPKIEGNIVDLSGK